MNRIVLKCRIESGKVWNRVEKNRPMRERSEMDIFVLGLHFVCVILSFFFIRFVAYQKKSSLCNYLLLFSIAVLVNGLSYLFELKSGTIEEALMAIRFEYFGLSTATIAALLFICELFNVKLKKWIRGLVVAAFFMSCIMIVTNEYHHLH